MTRTLRAGLETITTLAGCCAAVVVVAFALDLIDGTALARMSAPTVAQCDTDTDCAAWCRKHGMDCDGGPESSTKLAEGGK